MDRPTEAATAHSGRREDQADRHGDALGQDGGDGRQEPSRGDPPYLPICLLALLARLAVPWPPMWADPDPGSDFVRYALRIAEGRSFGPSALVPPAYPFLLGAIFRLHAPSAHSVALAQAILGALAAIPALALAKAAELSRRGVWMAGLLVALFPASLAATRHATPVPLAACLFAAAAAFLLRDPTGPRFHHALIGGILLGTAVLARSGAIVAAAFLALAVPVARRTPDGARRSRNEIVLARSFILATAILVTIPWSARNTRIHGRPTLTETTWGLRLRAATIPSTPAYRLPDPARETARPDNLVLSDNSLALWETAGYLRRHPGAAVRLWLGRSADFLSPFPATDSLSAGRYPHRLLAFRAAHAAVWGLVVSLLLSWLILLRARGGTERTLGWAALGFVLAGVIAGAVAEARVLALPLVAVPALRGAGGLRAWGDAGGRRRRLFLLGTAAVWALAVRGLLAG